MAARVMNTKSKSKPINLWIQPFSGLPMSLIKVNPQFGFKKFTILSKLPAPAMSLDLSPPAQETICSLLYLNFPNL